MTKTVLAVDDKQTILDQYNPLLGAHYELITTTSPRRAIVIAREKSIDLLISDIDMDEMFGPTLITEINSINPEIKKILTSSGSRASVATALELLEALRIEVTYVQKVSSDQISPDLLQVVESLIGR